MKSHLLACLLVLIGVLTFGANAAQSLHAAPPIAPAVSTKVFLPMVIRGNVSGGGGGGGISPTLGGCPLFPSDSVWNTRIDNLPVDARSATMINAIGANYPLVPDFGPDYNGGMVNGKPYNLVPPSQPLVPITFDYVNESDPGPYPIPPNPAQDSGTDHHVLVLQTGNCVLYETWHARIENGAWKAGVGAKWNLNSNALRPAGWTAADAAGMPITPLLVKYDEVIAGEIRHAIRFTVNGTNNEYIWPARHRTYSNYSPDNPPMGQRFRLKASFDISGFSPQVQVLLTAFKRYGIIVGDNSGRWFIGGAPDQRWDYGMFYTELQRVHGSDFEAIDESSLMVDPNSGQARQ